jgi:hypothetical protein
VTNLFSFSVKKWEEDDEIEALAQSPPGVGGAPNEEKKDRDDEIWPLNLIDMRLNFCSASVIKNSDDAWLRDTEQYEQLYSLLAKRCVHLIVYFCCDGCNTLVAMVVARARSIFTSRK